MYVGMNFIACDLIENALSIFLKLDCQILSGAQNFDAGFFIYNHLGDFSLASPYLYKAAAHQDKDATSFLKTLKPEVFDTKLDKPSDAKLVTQFSFFQRALVNSTSSPSAEAAHIANLVDDYLQEPPAQEGVFSRIKKNFRIPFVS